MESDQPKGLCGMSLLELAIHFRKGHMPEISDLAEFFRRALAKNLELVELTPDVALATNELPEDFHGDPFDRTIAATARVHGLKCITTDPEIRRLAHSGFCEVEFYRFRPGP
jgi:PIN domain nuclease of toxin-antitoxin system